MKIPYVFSCAKKNISKRIQTKFTYSNTLFIPEAQTGQKGDSLARMEFRTSPSENLKTIKTILPNLFGV